MQIANYIAKITGKTIEELFALGSPLVVIEQSDGEAITVKYWDASLAASKPTDADIKKALAAPEEDVVPLSVSARQFKLQLLTQSILDQVDTYIAGQSKAVQIAYEYSSAFVRYEPMMSAGFKAMNFTDDQIDAFFVAASKL